VYPPGEAREDWKIIRAASEVLGARLPYDSLSAVRARLAEASPVFARVDHVERRGCEDQAGPAGDPAAMSDAPFVLPISNYWQADVISRASEIMAECARVIPATAAPERMAAE
jgi:NADH-quinone oxidoreductase subunit G